MGKGKSNYHTNYSFTKYDIISGEVNTIQHTPSAPDMNIVVLLKSLILL